MKDYKIDIRMIAVCLVLTLVSFSACTKKQTVKKTDEPKEVAENVDSEELDVHGKDFVSAKELSMIHFDYDSVSLSQEARKVLSKNADYLKKNSDFEILAEGHCDERGTIAYNLALGQKRAQTVRKYYTSLGIDGKRVGAVSFGEEKPVCYENTENCWAENRRGETKVRALKVAENGKMK